jgi:tetratricopeptide (TPR) repeat protein
MPEDLSEKIVRVLQKLILPIAGVTVLVLIASAAVYFIDQAEQEKIAQSYDSLFLLKKESEKIAEPWAPEVDTKDPKAAKKEKKQPSDEEKKQAYAPLLEKILAHIKANQGNQVAVEGALLAADIGKSYNDPQVGIEALRSALSDVKSTHFLFAIGQAELGSLLAKADKCSEAAQAWEKVIVVKEHAYVANNLRLKSGVCYEKIGMYEKAEGVYQDIISKSPNTSAARTAKKFLLHIKYVKNKGDLDAGNKKTNG